MYEVVDVMLSTDQLLYSALTSRTPEEGEDEGRKGEEEGRKDRSHSTDTCCFRYSPLYNEREGSAWYYVVIYLAACKMNILPDIRQQ